MFQAYTAKFDGLKEGGTGVSIFCVHVRFSVLSFGASSLGEPNIEYRHSPLSFNSNHPSFTNFWAIPKGATLAHPSLKRPSISHKTSKQAAAAERALFVPPWIWKHSSTLTNAGRDLWNGSGEDGAINFKLLPICLRCHPKFSIASSTPWRYC